MKLRMKMEYVRDRAIAGLTAGKIYIGSVVPVIDQRNTQIEISMNKFNFLVFNDDGRWHAYSSHYFEPAE